MGRLADYRSRPLRLGLVTRDDVLRALVPRYLKPWPLAVAVPLDDHTALGADPLPWDIILWGLDEAPLPEWLLPGRLAPGAGRRPVLIGLTGDAEIMEREQLGRGQTDDCLLMPITQADLTRVLRNQMLKVR